MKIVSIKVSIIVPVYNVEKYIVRCFDSVANQTYKNIECIFVDDCSPDNCNKIINKLIADYKGSIEFKQIVHEHNKGLSGARNTGTLNARGDYIYYLDSDDDITPEAIDILCKSLIKYPNTDIVQGNTETIPNPKKRKDWRDISLKDFSEYYDDPIWVKAHIFMNPSVPVNAWNKLIRKDFLMDNNLFFKEGIIHEDEHWIFYVAKKIESILFVNKKIYNHYINPGSIMNTGSYNKSLSSFYEIISEFRLNYDEVLLELQELHTYDLLNRSFFMVFKSNDINMRRKINIILKELIIENFSKKRFSHILILLSIKIPTLLKGRGVTYRFNMYLAERIYNKNRI